MSLERTDIGRPHSLVMEHCFGTEWLSEITTWTSSKPTIRPTTSAPSATTALRYVSHYILLRALLNSNIYLMHWCMFQLLKKMFKHDPTTRITADKVLEEPVHCADVPDTVFMHMN